MLGKIKQALMKNHDPARVNDNCLVNDITILICEGGHIVLKNPVLIQAVWHIGGKKIGTPKIKKLYFSKTSYTL